MEAPTRYPVNAYKKLNVIYPTVSDSNTLAPGFCFHLSVLKAGGFMYRLKNYYLKNERDNYLIEFSRQFKNDLIYLYFPNITYFSKLGTLLERLKKNGSFIIVGGNPTITVNATKVLSCIESIDVFIRSPESEKCLLELLKGIQRDKSLESLQGITFRQPGTNQVITTPNPPLSDNLDHLSCLEFLGQKIPGKINYPLLTSRGCNHNCQYCGLQVPYQLNHKNETNFWRKRSAKKIVDEIEALMRRGVDTFAFYCEQFFNSQKARGSTGQAKEIALEILKRKIEPKLSFTAKASDLIKNFDSLFLLREAGLEKIYIGIDSGLERFHRIYETGSSVEDNINVLQQMHDHLFNFDFSFIFFDPYLKLEEIQQNLNFLEKITRFFSHLPALKQKYLENDVLDSILILQHGMPIIKKLENDNLVMPEPHSFSSRYEIKFKHSRVKTVYSIFKMIKKNLAFFSNYDQTNRTTSESNHNLNLLSVSIMRKILNDVAGGRVNSIPEYILETASYLLKTDK